MKLTKTRLKQIIKEELTRQDKTDVKKIVKDELEKLAVESGIADKFLEGRPAKRIIVVPGRLVNIVG